MHLQASAQERQQLGPYLPSGQPALCIPSQRAIAYSLGTQHSAARPVALFHHLSNFGEAIRYPQSRTCRRVARRTRSLTAHGSRWELAKGRMLAVFPDRFFCEGDHIGSFIAGARAQGEAEPVLEGEISTRITNQRRRQMFIGIRVGVSISVIEQRPPLCCGVILNGPVTMQRPPVVPRPQSSQFGPSQNNAPCARPPARASRRRAASPSAAAPLARCR